VFHIFISSLNSNEYVMALSDGRIVHGERFNDAVTPACYRSECSSASAMIATSLSSTLHSADACVAVAVSALSIERPVSSRKITWISCASVFSIDSKPLDISVRNWNNLVGRVSPHGSRLIPLLLKIMFLMLQLVQHIIISAHSHVVRDLSTRYSEPALEFA